VNAQIIRITLSPAGNDVAEASVATAPLGRPDLLTSTPGSTTRFQSTDTFKALSDALAFADANPSVHLRHSNRIATSARGNRTQRGRYVGDYESRCESAEAARNEARYY
jgi:hypothetical protein